MPIKRSFIGRTIATTLAVSACAATTALAQDAASGMTTVVPGDTQWQKSPDMPYGMQTMLLAGDPSRPGAYVYRVRVPSGYRWPPMRYPDQRVTTVLKGRLWAAQGERYDPTKMKELEAGAIFVTPADTPHYQWARTEVILQIVGTGPVDNPVTYVNPDDDPRSE